MGSTKVTTSKGKKCNRSEKTAQGPPEDYPGISLGHPKGDTESTKFIKRFTSKKRYLEVIPGLSWDDLGTAETPPTLSFII